MFKFLLQTCLIGLLFWASASNASGYKIYHDKDGHVYLEAPKNFTLVKSKFTVPMQVTPHNGLLRLYEQDGEWKVEALTAAQWQQLSLFEGSPLVNKVQTGDLDADGIVDLFIGLNDQITPYVTLSRLRGILSVYAGRGEHGADQGSSYQIADADGDGLFELVSGYTVYPKAIGRFRARSFAAAELAVGQTQAEFRVDESGAATYSIPLNIPAGIAGVQPQLSLVYSSSAGDGYMGAGWSFSGASAITRCPKNLLIDKTQGRVGFNASDRLCLDGQRLINANAPADSASQTEKDRLYWSSTTYYKELSDFTVIRPHGSAVQGHTAYSVETKSGEIHYYGEITAVSGNDNRGKSLALALRNTAGSSENGSDALFEVPGITTARFWALKAIKDVKDNYMLFKYVEDQTKGEHYLQEVHYTGRGTQAPFAKVVLNYEEASKKRIGYQAGYPASMTQLMKSVTVFQDGNQYRHYQLGYFQSDVLEEKTYLTSLQECTTAAMTNCYPSLTFDWLKPAPVSTSIYRVCATGDPADCWDEAATDNFEPFALTTTTQGASANRHHHQMIDLNGDGFADLLYPRNNRWNVRFGNQAGTFSGENNLSTIGATPRTIFDVSNNYLSQTIDYNGDGQRDLLVANSAGSNWYIITYQPTTTISKHCEREPRTPVVCEDVELTTVYKEIDTGKIAHGLEGGSFIADFDGDGLEDIVFIKDQVFQAYINNGMIAGVHQGFTHQQQVGTLADQNAFNFELQRNIYTPNSQNSAMLDVNGDGKTELLLKVMVSFCSNPQFDNKVECEQVGAFWRTQRFWRVYSASTGSYLVTDEIRREIKNVRVVDLNGDGYSDLMYQEGTSWLYQLSDGNKLLPAVNAGLSTPADRANLTYFLDLNADGRTDILLPTTNSSWSIMLSRPHNYPNRVVFESRGNRTFDANAAIQFADVNGDSKLDLLTSTDDHGWKIALNSRDNIHDHRIETLTTGWGVPTYIEYANLTKPGIYYRQVSSNAINSDYFVPKTGVFVVSKVSSEVQPGRNLSVSYAYGGLLVHKKGRGLLGFEYLKTTDNQSAVVTETAYYQHWPYTGIPKDTLQTYGTLVMSYSSNTVAKLTAALGGVFPFVQTSTEQSYKLNSALSVSTPLAATSSNFVYDTSGNLTSSQIIVSDPLNAGNKLLTNTTSVFDSTPAYQRYGRMTSSTVRKQLFMADVVTSDISRNSSFSYNTDFLLQTEVAASDHLGAKSTTTYGYDAAGNKTTVTVNAGTEADGVNPVNRISKTTFTNNFRFVASTTDTMGKSSNYFYNGVLATNFTPALVTSIAVVSPNNQRSTTNFDAFGHSISSSVKGALTSDATVSGSVTKSYCTGCDNAFENAYIKIVTSSDTGAEQQQFLDKYGRELGGKTKLPLATGYSVSKKTYDQQGRADKVFEPGIGNASSLVSTVTYDSLGRPSQTLLANGGVTKVDVEGYTTTHTDALLKTKSTTSNYLGQTITSTDHLGSVLSFSYNAFGDLLTASFAGVTRVSNQYDPYGRKISMSDIDKGNWLYSTNGFGELISQTNAKGENSRLSYNNAGQLTRRSDGAGTVCWTYGETAASYNVNQLTQVNQWTTDVACTSPTTPVYTETYSYNSKALVQSKTITIGGQNYVSSSSYDNFGRPDIQTFPSAAGITGPAIRTEYSNGVAYKQTDTSTGVVYQEALEFTARGQSSQVAYGNGVRATFSYDEATGWLEGNTVAKGGTTLQSYWYDFDDVGNVVNRQLGFGVGSRANLTETFKYDDLHRLKSRTVDSALNLSGALAMSQSFSYDKMGNIENKPGVGLYNFSYDANGNITHDGKRTFAYTVFEKPYRITQGSDTTDFVYGPNRELLQRIDQRGPHLTRSLMLDGYEQVSLPGGVVEHKYSVGDAIITKRSNSSSDVFYLHKDQQGSTSSITNASGNLVQQLMYDPWGKQQVVNTSLLTYSSPATSKGYTGHEMVIDFEVIHMGGRTYNPVLGRFMQADPFIQQAENLQSYNRYSYVLNNPMSYTDPSGYFFKKLHKLLGDFAPVFGIALLAIPGVGQWAASAWWKAAIIGFASGGVATGSLRGALIGAITGAAFQQVGSHFGVKYNGADFGSLGLSEQLQWAGSHALVGGVASSLSGGKFGHGFISAGFTKIAMGNAGFNYDDVSSGAIAGRTTIAALIGGTASAISGGKFANGAQTAAMAQLFNAEATNYREKVKSWRAAEAAVKSRLLKEGYTIVSGRTSAKYDGDWYIRGREYDVVAYKIVDNQRVYELIEVKFLQGDTLNYASGAASKSISMRKMAQALVVTRQVYFDLNAENITLSGGQFGKGHVLSPKNYNVSWEFVRSNGRARSRTFFEQLV